MKNRTSLSWWLCGLLLLSSCSSTKNIPEDDQLFTGLTKIEYTDYEDNDHFTATQEEIEAALATAPNGAIFGSSYYRMPSLGLWIWNTCNGSDNWFKKWMNKTFGKAPVLMSQVNPRLRASVARSVLRKNGYLHGDVVYTEVPQKNPKKMKIGYRVRLDSLFRVDSMSYQKFPVPMQALIDSTLDEVYIRRGSPFAVSSLDAERTRLSRLFRDNGYYGYSAGYASYLADTFDVPNRARLRLQMADSLSTDVTKKWYIGSMQVNLRRTMAEQLNDSMGRRFLKVYYNGKRPPVRPRVILRDMKLRPREPFSYSAYQESVSKINAAGIFSQADMTFTPRAGTDTLDMQLNCTFDKPYDFYVETTFNSRTIGRMGPEAKVGLTIRNAFRGAEKLDVNLHGSYEWETGDNSSGMSTYQYGADVAVEFPRIIAPFVGESAPRRGKDGRIIRPKEYNSTPWTVAKLSADIINRPSYYRMQIFSGEWSYRWQPMATRFHSFVPLIVKYQYMSSHTQKFEDIVSENTYLLTAMDDYFIPKMRYTYTYKDKKTTRNPIRWETSIEESGNFTSLCLMAFGEKWNKQDKELFNTPYSQFVKIETDFTKTWQLDASSQLVAHANAGHMWVFGNSDAYPFSEGFYVGGANTIRAFTVRSIGPGSCTGLRNRQASYMMQHGNTKLVFNLEYRRRLFGSLYGAIFLDAGNVWSNLDLTLQPEEGEIVTPEEQDIIDRWNSVFSDTQLRLKSLPRQLATGTGLGLRYDLDFLILRVDWGFGFHVPYDTGKSGYFNIPTFKDMHSLHLAIGYPF